MKKNGKFYRFLSFIIVFLISICFSKFSFPEKLLPANQSTLTLSFAPLVKMTAPSVVNIFTTKEVRTTRFPTLFDDPFFRRFFGNQFQGKSQGRRKVQNSLGSGVIVGPNGTIITNYHVVSGSDQIRVVLEDRREFDAKIVAMDERTDLAILKINAGEAPLPYLEFRDSDSLEVGDIVLAIGNPFGVGQTVTSGIVSALARTQVGINDLNFFIQTDAAINPGNSGGALVTLDGRLVGVNSAIFSKGGGSIGIGFAIPSNMVRSVIDGVSANGRIVRPWLGAKGTVVDSNIAESLGMNRPIGVLLSDIYQKGPADRSGLRVNDIITEVNGHEVNDFEALKFRIATNRLGHSVDIKVLRRGSYLLLKFPVERPPNVPKGNRTKLGSLSPLQGVMIANISPELADRLGINMFEKGVIIVDVEEGSTASRFGFKEKDILREINERTIRQVSDIKKLLTARFDHWRIQIERGGKDLSLSVRR